MTILKFTTSMVKIFVIAWSIWICRNKVIFNELNATPADVVNLTISCLNEMKCYNFVLSLLGQDRNAGNYTNQRKQ